MSFLQLVLAVQLCSMVVKATNFPQSTTANPVDKVPPHHIKTYQIEKQENSTLESVTSAIHFMVTTQHFLKGQMRLKCTSNIFDIFKEEIESVIEEDRPRIMASGRSYDINNYPLEEHTNNGERGYEDHNESYLTYYSADNSASSASTAAHEIFWHIWLTKLTKELNRLRGAWQFVDAFAAWISGIVGGASLLLYWLLAHQIIDCQCAKTTTTTRRRRRMMMMMMKQQSTEDIKCFYNCQTATLCHQPGNLDIASVVNAGDDLTAMEQRHQQLSATLAAALDGADANRHVGVSGWDQRLLMTWQQKELELAKCISC